MLYDILFVLAIFVTRVVLPIFATMLLGSWLERVLRRGVHPA